MSKFSSYSHLPSSTSNHSNDIGKVNLTYIPSANGGQIITDTGGTAADLILTSSTQAGLMTPAQQESLEDNTNSISILESDISTIDTQISTLEYNISEINNELTTVNNELTTVNNELTNKANLINGKVSVDEIPILQIGIIGGSSLPQKLSNGMNASISSDGLGKLKANILIQDKYDSTSTVSAPLLSLTNVEDIISFSSKNIVKFNKIKTKFEANINNLNVNTLIMGLKDPIINNESAQRNISNMTISDFATKVDQAFSQPVNYNLIAQLINNYAYIFTSTNDNISIRFFEKSMIEAQEIASNGINITFALDSGNGVILIGFSIINGSMYINQDNQSLNPLMIASTETTALLNGQVQSGSIITGKALKFSGAAVSGDGENILITVPNSNLGIVSVILSIIPVSTGLNFILTIDSIPQPPVLMLFTDLFVNTPNLYFPIPINNSDGTRSFIPKYNHPTVYLYANSNAELVLSSPKMLTLNQSLLATSNIDTPIFQLDTSTGGIKLQKKGRYIFNLSVGVLNIGAGTKALITILAPDGTQLPNNTSLRFVELDTTLIQNMSFSQFKSNAVYDYSSSLITNKVSSLLSNVTAITPSILATVISDSIKFSNKTLLDRIAYYSNINITQDISNPTSSNPTLSAATASGGLSNPTLNFVYDNATVGLVVCAYLISFTNPSAVPLTLEADSTSLCIEYAGGSFN
jgi:hypothetical protein